MTRSAPSSSAGRPVSAVQNCPPATSGRGSRAPRRATRTSATPSSTPAVAVESATRSGCSRSTSATRSARRRARPEQQHLPAVGLEEVGDHPRAERVLLAGRAAHDRQPAVARRAPHLRAEARRGSTARSPSRSAPRRRRARPSPSGARPRAAPGWRTPRYRSGTARPPRARVTIRAARARNPGQQGAKERVDGARRRSPTRQDAKKPWTYGAYRVRRTDGVACGHGPGRGHKTGRNRT